MNDGKLDVSFDAVTLFEDLSKEELVAVDDGCRKIRGTQVFWRYFRSIFNIKFVLVVLFLLFGAIPSGIIVSITIFDLNKQLNIALAERAAQAKNVTISWIEPLIGQQFSAATTTATMFQQNGLQTNDFKKASKIMFTQLVYKPQFQYIYYANSSDNSYFSYGLDNNDDVYARMGSGDQQYQFQVNETSQTNGSLLVFPPVTPPTPFSVRSLPLYDKAMNSTTPIISNFYFDTVMSTFLVDALVPFLNSNGQTVGFVGVSSSIFLFSSLLHGIIISPNSAVYIVTNDGMLMIGSSNLDEVLFTKSPPKILRLSQSSISWVATLGSMFEGTLGTNILPGQIISGRYYVNPTTSYYVDTMPYNDIRGINWTIIIFVRTDDLLGPVASLRTTVGITEGLIILVSIIFSLILAFMITAPLDYIRKELQRLRKVDLQPLPSSRGVRKIWRFIQSREVFYEVQTLGSELRNMTIAMRGFVKYVPIELVRSFLNHPQTDAFFRPFVSSREIAIIFSDIVNFGGIAAKLDSKSLIEDVLTVYFESVSRIIKHNGGTLDKYIGNIVMAFWNAPNEVNDFVYKTCKAALAINMACKKMTERFAKKGMPAIHVRIGVHVGECLVGNIGSPVRINYTAIGDAVNLASRLTSANKRYGTSIIISEQSQKSLNKRFPMRALDKVAVKGKKQEVLIFELIPNGSSNRRLELAEKFSFAYQELFLKREFGKALIEFEAYLLEFPNDAACKKYIAECTHFLEEQPDKDWTGLHVLDSK